MLLFCEEDSRYTAKNGFHPSCAIPHPLPRPCDVRITVLVPERERADHEPTTAVDGLRQQSFRCSAALLHADTAQLVIPVANFSVPVCAAVRK